ncbi:MAG TPA: DUF1634 domain-containing protein [Pirellulales bacterium]|jgi:uncharacterized membrane protein|nr:DUF1634 domain-containing protein [Pirellulales bacterium]
MENVPSASTAETKQLGRWVHWTLMIGVAVSGLLLALGLVLLQIQGQAAQPAVSLRPWPLLQNALAGFGEAWIWLGLLALMLTPIVRVAALAIGWGRLGDYRFMFVALVVLILLGLSISLGVG